MELKSVSVSKHTGLTLKSKEPKPYIFKLSKRCNVGNKCNHQLLDDKTWHFKEEPYSIITDLKPHPCIKTKPENQSGLIHPFFWKEGSSDIKTLWFWLSAQGCDSFKHLPVPIKINENKCGV